MWDLVAQHRGACYADYLAGLAKAFASFESILDDASPIRISHELKLHIDMYKWCSSVLCC